MSRMNVSQIQVPEELTGLVIGKGGTRINNISNTHHVGIRCKDNVFTIRGENIENIINARAEIRRIYMQKILLDEKCPICLEEMKEENGMATTKCGHKFHLHCLLKSLDSSNSCPMCRSEVRTCSSISTGKIQEINDTLIQRYREEARFYLLASYLTKNYLFNHREMMSLETFTSGVIKETLLELSK